MKKFISFILVVQLLFLCVACNDGDYKNMSQQKEPLQNEISKHELVFDPEMLQDEASYDGDIIINENIAKQFSDLILVNTLKETLEDYQSISVGLDANDGVWVIGYGKDDQTLGGDINIALSKRTGEVIKIWYGE